MSKAEQNLSYSDAMQHDLINNDVIHYDLATGQLYRIPKSLKITTAQHRNPFSAPAPQVSDLTFSVKPAAEVSEQDISRAQDYAHKSGYPTDKLKHNTLRLKRRTVASVYENVLDNLESSANLPAKFKVETEQWREQKYTLFERDRAGVEGVAGRVARLNE